MATGVLPADAIAASLCWLARNRHGDLAKTISDAVDKGVGYWHKAGCRFCRMPMEELLTKYGLANVEPGSYADFTALDRKARAARIREAQEVQWYDTLGEPDS